MKHLEIWNARGLAGSEAHGHRCRDPPQVQRADFGVAALLSRGALGTLPQQAANEIVALPTYDLLAWRNGASEFVDPTLQFPGEHAVVPDQLAVGFKAINGDRSGHDGGCGLFADSLDRGDPFVRPIGQGIEGFDEQFLPSLFFLERMLQLADEFLNQLFVQLRRKLGNAAFCGFLNLLRFFLCEVGNLRRLL